MEEQLIKFIWFCVSDLFTAVVGCVAIYLLKKRRITPYEARQLLDKRRNRDLSHYSHYFEKIVKRCPELKEKEDTEDEEKKSNA